MSLFKGSICTYIDFVKFFFAETLATKQMLTHTGNQADAVSIYLVASVSAKKKISTKL